MTLVKFFEALPAAVEAKHAAGEDVIELGTESVDALELLIANMQDSGVSIAREILAIAAAPSAMSQGATGRALIWRALRSASSACLSNKQLTEQQVVDALLPIWS